MIVHQCDNCKGYDPGDVEGVVAVQLRITPYGRTAPATWKGDLCVACRVEGFGNIEGLKEYDGNAGS